MNAHHCPVCGVSVDADGNLFPVPFMPRKSTPIVCVVHRRQALKERFKVKVKMVHNGIHVTSEEKYAAKIYG